MDRRRRDRLNLRNPGAQLLKLKAHSLNPEFLPDTCLQAALEAGFAVLAG